MGLREFFDVLLGRTRPVSSQLESLFAMSTAYITLTTSHGHRPAGRAGICFRPVSSSRFAALGTELRDLLKLSTVELQMAITTMTDPFNFQWVLLENQASESRFEDLVTALHMTSVTLRDGGFGEQLLAAVFRFEEGEVNTDRLLEESTASPDYAASPTDSNLPFMTRSRDLVNSTSQTNTGATIYWVYNYKRGTYYPFIPTGDRVRNNVLELRLSALMERELPIEKDYERWFPLWGIPV